MSHECKCDMWTLGVFCLQSKAVQEVFSLDGINAVSYKNLIQLGIAVDFQTEAFHIIIF